jgi:restriction endonuclease S subunit
LKVKLSDIATIRTGLVVARKKAQLDSEQKVRYVQVSLRCFGSGVTLNQLHTDEFTSAEELDTKYFTQEGDILVRLRSPSLALYIKKEDEGLLINSLLSIIRIDDENVNAKYVAYYINSKTTERQLRLDMQSTAIPMVKTRDLENLDIVLPPLAEQKKLVALLDLAQKEQDLLQKLIDEKKQLSQTILDTIIQQNKEAKCQKK